MVSSRLVKYEESNDSERSAIDDLEDAADREEQNIATNNTYNSKI